MALNKSCRMSNGFTESYILVYIPARGCWWGCWRSSGALQVGSGTCIDLHFTCISFGAFSPYCLYFDCIISYLCILTLKGIGGMHSIISLYVRIIAYAGHGCVVLWETDEDFAKALSGRGLWRIVSPGHRRWPQCQSGLTDAFHPQLCCLSY